MYSKLPEIKKGAFPPLFIAQIVMKNWSSPDKALKSYFLKYDANA